MSQGWIDILKMKTPEGGDVSLTMTRYSPEEVQEIKDRYLELNWELTDEIHQVIRWWSGYPKWLGPFLLGGVAQIILGPIVRYILGV